MILFRSSQAIRASVEIRRPVHEVFAFYRDFSNLPLFIGDVVAVETLGPGWSRWTVIGPFGFRTTFKVALTDVRADALICYRSVTAFGVCACWELRFAPAQGGGTRIDELLTLPFGAIGRAALALIGKFPAAEVRANLARLKRLLERPIS